MTGGLPKTKSFSIFQIPENRSPSWPEPNPISTFLPQLGQLTGSENMVALLSMSGALNLCPQCGHFTFTNPLSMVSVFIAMNKLSSSL